MTTPVLRGSTAPLPGRPDGTPFGQNTLQATSPDATLVGDLVVAVSWHGTPSSGASLLTLRSGEGWTQVVNYFHDDTSTHDGSFAVAWKLATAAGAQVYQAFNTTSPATDCRTALRVYQVGTFDTAVFPFAGPVSFTDGNAAPDPANLTGLDATRDYLIEAIAGWWLSADLVDCLPGAPSGYANLIETAAGGWLELALANKAVSAATSEDPAAYSDNVDSTNNRGSVAFTLAILGAPGTTRRAIIGWDEFEVPDPTTSERRAIIGWDELEVPNQKYPDSLQYLFHPVWSRYRYQTDTPGVDTERRAIIGWDELEVPDAARRAIISWDELQVPSPGGLAVGAYIARPPATQDPPYTSSIGRFPDCYRENLGGSGGLDENNNWTWIANPNLWYNFTTNWASWFNTHPNRRFVWMVEMCPWLTTRGTNAGGALSQIVNGSRDTEWRAFADYLAANNLGSPLYILLGWEMETSSFAHSCAADATKMANFKAAWIHIVDLVRDEQPGLNIKWCFCPSTRAYKNRGRTWAEAIYAGDDYVDLIGGDFYDNTGSSGGYSIPPTAQQKIDIWTSTHQPALQIQNDMAVAHGKPQFWGEWALCHHKTSGTNGGDDNPYFIQKSYEWATEHDYEFVAYFNANTSTIDHSLTTFGSVPLTNGRAEFLSSFGQLPHPWE